MFVLSESFGVEKSAKLGKAINNETGHQTNYNV